MDASEIDQLLEKIQLLKQNIQKKIVGQELVINQLLIAFLAGGHALLEGVPGLAKTLLVRTLAASTDLLFKRIQFTPDLMPSDIIGTEVLQQSGANGYREFVFRKGPLFANIVLADEINRTPPKTQSALLEAMQEKAVTYAGQSYQMPAPFFILATQNPIEQAGTFPLPEAQRDRFLLAILIDYPSETEEVEILKTTTGKITDPIQAVFDQASILQLQELVREVFIGDHLLKYVNQLVRQTRPVSSSINTITSNIQWGAGPRAGQSIIMAAKANALMQGRYAVVPDDIHQVIYPVLRHRLLLNFKAEAEGLKADQIIADLLDAVELPKEKIN